MLDRSVVCFFFSFFFGGGGACRVRVTNNSHFPKREDGSEVNSERVERLWEDEKGLAEKNKRKPELWRAVWRSIRTRVLVSIFISVFQNILQFLGPVSLYTSRDLCVVDSGLELLEFTFLDQNLKFQLLLLFLYICFPYKVSMYSKYM